MRSTALRKGEFGDGFMQRWGLHSASALIASPMAPMQQQLSTSRIAAPQMNNGVVRVEIELEDGEP